MTDTGEGLKGLFEQYRKDHVAEPEGDNNHIDLTVYDVYRRVLKHVNLTDRKLRKDLNSERALHIGGKMYETALEVFMKSPHISAEEMVSEVKNKLKEGQMRLTPTQLEFLHSAAQYLIESKEESFNSISKAFESANIELPKFIAGFEDLLNESGGYQTDNLADLESVINQNKKIKEVLLKDLFEAIQIASVFIALDQVEINITQYSPFVVVYIDNNDFWHGMNINGLMITNVGCMIYMKPTVSPEVISHEMTHLMRHKITERVEDKYRHENNDFDGKKVGMIASVEREGDKNDLWKQAQNEFYAYLYANSITPYFNNLFNGWQQNILRKGECRFSDLEDLYKLHDLMLFYLNYGVPAKELASLIQTSSGPQHAMERAAVLFKIEEKDIVPLKDPHAYQYCLWEDMFDTLEEQGLDQKLLQTMSFEQWVNSTEVVLNDYVLTRKYFTEGPWETAYGNMINRGDVGELDKKKLLAVKRVVDFVLQEFSEMPEVLQWHLTDFLKNDKIKGNANENQDVVDNFKKILLTNKRKGKCFFDVLAEQCIEIVYERGYDIGALITDLKDMKGVPIRKITQPSEEDALSKSVQGRLEKLPGDRNTEIVFLSLAFDIIENSIRRILEKVDDLGNFEEKIEELMDYFSNDELNLRGKILLDKQEDGHYYLSIRGTDKSVKFEEYIEIPQEKIFAKLMKFINFKKN